MVGGHQLDSDERQYLGGKIGLKTLNAWRMLRNTDVLNWFYTVEKKKKSREGWG